MLRKRVVATCALCAFGSIGMARADEVTIRGSASGHSASRAPLSFEGAAFSTSTTNGLASTSLGTFSLENGPLTPASKDFTLKLTLTPEAGGDPATRIIRATVTATPQGGVLVHFVTERIAARFDNGAVRGSFSVKPQDLSIAPGETVPLLAEFSGSQETDTACQVTFVSGRATPQILELADQKMRPITIKPLATDRAGCALTCKIQSVSISEPQATAGDYEITGDLTLKVRADRLNDGPGRLYSVAVRCSDNAGNAVIQNVPVAVPSRR